MSPFWKEAHDFHRGLGCPCPHTEVMKAQPARPGRGRHWVRRGTTTVLSPGCQLTAFQTVSWLYPLYS